MQLAALARRFFALPADERGYFLRRFVDLKVHRRAGFSQFGEDATVASYLKTIGRSCQSYVDIGANDPITHSNTYLFYRDGGRGMLVEANPEIAARIRRTRPRDQVLNVGVLPHGAGIMDLHVMDLDGLSTMSAQWREDVEDRDAGKPIKVVQVPTIGINDLLNKHLGRTSIDFASLDIEGLDFEVLSAWDFDRWRPFLFCVETLKPTAGQYVQDQRFQALLQTRGYRPIFNTYSNTIFLDAEA